MTAGDGIFVQRGGEPQQGDAIAVPHSAKARADLHPLTSATLSLPEEQPWRLGNLRDSLQLPQQPS